MNKTPSSKKTTQVVVASALGLALLVGGSTYALWSATDTATTAATITNGDLKVTASAPENWVDVTVPATPVTISDLANFRMVPGDTIQLTQSLNAVVYGDNITAQLKVAIPNATDVTTSPGDTANIAALADAKFTVSVFDKDDVLVGTAAPTTNGPDDLNVTIPSMAKTTAAGEAYTVVVTVNLPSSSGNATKGAVIALNDMVITLNQTAPVVIP